MIGPVAERPKVLAEFDLHGRLEHQENHDTRRQRIAELDAQDDETVELQKDEIEDSDPGLQPRAALIVDDQQDPEQAAGDRHDKSGHDRLPVPSGGFRKGIRNSDSEERQAELNAIQIRGLAVEGQVVDEEVGKDQQYPDSEAGLGVAIVEIVVVAAKILLVAGAGKGKLRPQRQGIGLRYTGHLLLPSTRHAIG